MGYGRGVTPSWLGRIFKGTFPVNSQFVVPLPGKRFYEHSIVGIKRLDTGGVRNSIYINIIEWTYANLLAAVMFQPVIPDWWIIYVHACWAGSYHNVHL